VKNVNCQDTFNSRSMAVLAYADTIVSTVCHCTSAKPYDIVKLGVHLNCT
jgi:hypothetical protein